MSRIAIVFYPPLDRRFAGLRKDLLNELILAHFPQHQVKFVVDKDGFLRAVQSALHPSHGPLEDRVLALVFLGRGVWNQTGCPGVLSIQRNETLREDELQTALKTFSGTLVQMFIWVHEEIRGQLAARAFLDSDRSPQRPRASDSGADAAAGGGAAAGAYSPPPNAGSKTNNRLLGTFPCRGLRILGCDPYQTIDVEQANRLIQELHSILAGGAAAGAEAARGKVSYGELWCRLEAVGRLGKAPLSMDYIGAAGPDGGDVPGRLLGSVFEKALR